MTSHFDPSLFGFLRELKRNNRREWFALHKARFEAQVRGPALLFITDFVRPLGRVSPHFVADPRPAGGSLFRQHRDTRFSKDKSPYKTHVGIHFRHRAGKDVHAPGFYLHLEPGTVFAGAGIWHPEPETLAAIRNAIVERGAAWRKAVTTPAFRRTCRLEGEALVRPPRGFDPEHPLIEDLKRKDFTAMARWSEKDALSAALPRKLEAFCKATLPFMRFLAQAVDLEA
jgi:uncharacterized protein (TIGR02453 family)